MVFQEESTFPWRTTLENVAFPLEAAGMAKAERLKRARALVQLVGLDGFENRYPAGAVGRHAPAHRARPHPRLPAQDPADGRALRLARRADAAAARRQAAANPGAAQADDAPHHPQHRRGGAAVRPRAGDDLPAGPGEADRARSTCRGPRTSEILGSEQFGRYVAMVWADLREEASKGLIESEAAVRRPSGHQFASRRSDAK